MNGLHSSSYFLSLHQSFCKCTQSTNYNWYNRHFDVSLFCNSQARSGYLSFFFLSFNFTLCSAGAEKSIILQVFFFTFFFFFFFNIIWWVRLVEIMGSVSLSKSQRSLWVSFFSSDTGLCIYRLFIWSNFNFLHNSQWITLPTQSCQVSYYFCANLLHAPLWLIVSSLSTHNLLFCRVLSNLALI